MLKTRAGISARGRKLKNPYTHLVLSWPEGATAPAKQDMLSAVAGALDSLGLDRRHYAVCAAHSDTNCPHVHVAVSRVDPETGRAVNLDKGATRRLGRWAEQYERNHGGIVVPTCRAARGAGGPPQARARLPPGRHAARAGPLYRRAPAPSVGEAAPRRPSLPAGSTPDQCARWTQLLERQRGDMQRQRTAEDERVERRRHEWRTCHAARAEAHAACGPRPFPAAQCVGPQAARRRRRTRIELRRPPTGPNARRARAASDTP